MKIKEYLKSRSIAFWILVIFSVVAIVLFFFGFRITYDPSLDNNWEAVSAVGSWASVIVASAAVVAALVIAKTQNDITTMQTTISLEQVRIADQQNKIALFERRFEFYDMIQNFHTVGGLIGTALDPPAAISLFVESFEHGNALAHKKNEKNVDYIRAHAVDLYDKVFNLMQQGDLLFDFDAASPLIPAVNAILTIISMDENDMGKYQQYRSIIIESAEKIDQELIPKVKHAMKLL